MGGGQEDFVCITEGREFSDNQKTVDFVMKGAAFIRWISEANISISLVF